MKPLLLIVFLFLSFIAFAQSPDYIAVRKKNGRTIKNFYISSQILLETTDGNYIQGPISNIRNDTVSILLYDIRLYRTMFGSVVRDTITVQTIPLHYKNIKRIQLSTHRSFFERNSGPLLMIGGGGYFLLNILNGALFNLPVTDKKNLKILGISAGAFGLGYLVNKLFASDGFSKKKHQIVYVDL